MSNIADWDRIAGTYAEVTGTPDDRIYHQLRDVLWESLGNLRGRRVLDVGCGHGWFTKLMIEAGANVVGVDGSGELLNRARQACPDVEFIERDLTTGLPATFAGFDRIVAYMVLMDLPEIGQLLGSVRRALTPDGKFVFTMPHSCFFNYKAVWDDSGKLVCGVKNYLESATWRIETFGGHWHYHRSLTDYFDQLRTAGFAVTRLYEPPHVATSPEQAEFARGIPKFILIEAIPL